MARTRKQPTEDAAAAGDASAMPLVEHLRELRTRVWRAALAIVLATVVAWAFYEPIFNIIRHPFDNVIDEAKANGRTVTLALNGVTDAFTLQLKISLITGLVLSAPVWLYQLWRFISPGLHRNERRWGYLFAGIATPFFAAGCAVGYLVLPKMLEVLLGFTPENVANIISIDYYLTFALQLMLFFGVGFLLPVTFMMLNFAGILSGRKLLSWWRFLVFGAFVFAAVATPTGDPITMLLVALPMLAMVFLAVAVTLLNDWRRGRHRTEPEWDDDEISDLEPAEHDPSDYVPSSLDEAEPVQPSAAPGGGTTDIT